MGKPSRSVWWWGLVLLVVLGHALSLFGLHRLAMGAASLKTMDEPLFTRMLTPSAPPLPPAATPPPPPPVVTKSLASALESALLGITETASISPAELALKAEPPLEPLASLPEFSTPSTSGFADAARLALDTLGVRTTSTLAAAPTVVATVSTTSYGSGTSTIDAWPSDTRLNYVVAGQYRGPIEGKASVTWQRVDNKYQVLLALDLGLVGVKMTSQGLVKPDTLWPQVYEEIMSKPRKLRLDDEALAFSDGGTAPRPKGVQDTVSQFVEITQRFATGRAKLEVGSVVHIPLARPGGFNDWYYDVSLEESLPTRLNQTYKEMRAWHLTPRPIVNARGPITMEFWLVPELQYFPAKVRITLDKEAYLDLEVASIQQR